MQAVFDVLEQLVAEGVLDQYALGGATAAGFHGEPLATRDIDIFVFLNPEATASLIPLNSVFTRLAELGFYEFEEETLLIHGFPVQFLIAHSPLEREAVTEADAVSWDSHRLRVMQPEYLAAIALTVGRPKDRARLVYLTSLTVFNRDHFDRILQQHHLTNRWHEWAKALDLLKE
jgi:hypothetical protein